MTVRSLYTTKSVLAPMWLLIRGQTFIGYSRRCDDNVCAVLIFKPLPEDVHV